VIERTPALRWLDMLGRRPAPQVPAVTIPTQPPGGSGGPEGPGGPEGMASPQSRGASGGRPPESAE
jgi:hypothetical protein